MNIVVLAGGESSEREVSLNSSRAVANALQQTGIAVELIDTRDGSNLLANPADSSEARALINFQASIPRPIRDADCVFIGLHGGIGENGKIQALLELCNVPYTGSGVLASALAMDKQRTKLIVAQQGVPIVPTLFFGRLAEALDFDKQQSESLPLPVVVKPNAEGSTVGLTIVRESAELGEAIKLAARHDDCILIEPYIPGRELTVSLLDGKALPVIEIVPKSGFYDYHSKYTTGATEYICPAQIPESATADIQRFSEICYNAVGCAGYARADFRLDPNDNLYFLELNTLPGMTSTSLVPKAARAAGIDFPDLIKRIVELGIRRHQLAQAAR